MKKTINSLMILFTLIMMIACSGGKQGSDQSTTSASDDGTAKGQAFIKDNISNPNILQIAMGSEDHTTLVAGVQAAGLENVLANNGPLTVFAPTNAAFDKLPDGTLENLLKPENQSTLRNIITFHAAAGAYKIDEFEDGMEFEMATSQDVIIHVKDGKVTVNGANVLGSVVATNGVVHIIDAVLLPPE